MLREEDAIRLRHMLDAATEALEHVKDRTRQDLDTDKQLAHSLVRCIEIIGEAASRVSVEWREAYPQISWSGMTGMRNRLIHAYFDINYTIVWKTVTEELPVLVSELEAILVDNTTE